MTVHLVGAGCGGPLWITLEGKRLLEKAEVVVYDNLIHPDLLQLAPRGCAFLPAGKRKGRACLKQPEINALLTDLGKTGKMVVRLKGGDPFVFGRGGEEAIALERAGVSWTFTPGITAALGGLGRAGIPPTHRGLADSITLVTGHTEEGGTPRSETWRALYALGGTGAIYMGASSWGELARRLREGGMPPGTPCAAVTRGGWGGAKTQSFSLGETLDSLPSPSILVAGGTAGFSLSPAKGSLAGLQVGVVRPAPESWHTARFVEELGADGYSLPVLTEEELSCRDEEKLLSEADWIVLTSPRGAALLPRKTDLRKLRGKIASIGPGTTEALARLGIRADGEALPSTSETLAVFLSKRVKKGEKVVFFRNEAGSSLPETAVRARGAEPVNIAAYRMVPSLPPGWESYKTLWKETGLDVLVFGSAALVEAWSRTAPPPPSATALIAWGKICGCAVERFFGRKSVVMEEPTLFGLEKKLTEIRKILEEKS